MKTTKKPSPTPLFPFWVTWTTYLFCFPWNCISSICLFSAAKYNPALDRPHPPTLLISLVNRFLGCMFCYVPFTWLMGMCVSLTEPQPIGVSIPISNTSDFCNTSVWLFIIISLIIYRNKKYWLVLFVVVNLFFTMFSTVFSHSYCWNKPYTHQKIFKKILNNNAVPVWLIGYLL